MLATIELPAGLFAPALDHALDDPLHGLGIVQVGAEVETFCISRAFVVELFGQREVTAQGLGWQPALRLDAALDMSVSWAWQRLSGQDIRQITLNQIQQYQRTACH
jgi:hypothetical protein